MKPEYNVPAVLLLCADSIRGQKNTITGGLFEIGCGWHAATRLRAVSGITTRQPSEVTPESISNGWKPLPESVLENIEFRKSLEIVNNDYEYTKRDVILYSMHD